MPLPATAPVRLTTAQKRSQAVILRRAGHTFEQIGAELGVSRTQAHRYVTAALKALHNTMVADTQLFITQEVERLDRVQAAWWARCLSGNRDAAAIVLKCIEQRSKLLGIAGPAPVPLAPLSAERVTPGGGPGAASPDGWNKSSGSGGPSGALSEALGILDAAGARAADGVDPADRPGPAED